MSAGAAPPSTAPPATRLPAWPGWLVALAGGLALVTGLGGAMAAAQGEIAVERPEVFTGATIAGVIAMAFGLVYASIRSILLRRPLPADRYRGPSPVVLLLLALIGATALQLLATDDVMALVEGRELSLAGSAIVLTSTQIGLLVVTGLFVVWPRALVGAPPFAGGALARSIVAGVGWGVAAWLAATLIAAAVTLAFEELGVSTDPQVVEQALSVLDPLVAVAAVVVLAPVAEEIFFRGVVYNAWRREHGRRVAMLGSSVLFAVIHLSLVQLLPIFVLGLVLAWTYERTRSLLAAIVVHATVNGISVTLALLMRYEIIVLPT